MARQKIAKILSDPDLIGAEITVYGWVKSARSQKNFSFIELTDGSCFSSLQIVSEKEMLLSTGTSVKITGTLVESPKEGQKVELQEREITVLGTAPEDYPLQKKRHSFEFLRTIAHLRPRTNTFGAGLRMRSHLAFAAHLFFREKGFFYVHTPIITGSDCEGAGEMFRVTTLGPHSTEKETDFFGKPTFLTVSGQLNGEALALACSDIYTFGPTFRAENSNTSRHLSEFWMIEPEMAFADLEDDMALAQDYLVFLIGYVLKNCREDLVFFDTYIEKGLIARLENVLTAKLVHIPYTDAIHILQKAPVTFEFPVSWGLDLQSEHERYLTEKHCNAPVIVYNYPKEIKAFYMRDNDDGKTVAAMDLLVPGTGELIGGSQREERYDRLLSKMKAAGLGTLEYEWYLDLRRFGSAPHAGFGLGFERLVPYITRMENIRDVIPFPRTPKHCTF